MSEEKTPKFQIGDEVRIEFLDLIGKVTNIIHLPSHFIYEINQTDGFFFEESLQALTEKNHDKKESLVLSFRYDFDDFVKVNGYGDDIYKVVGKRLEVWRYKSDTWEDVIYELSRITDGEWLESNEADMIAVDWSKDALDFLNKKKQNLWKNKWSRLDNEKLKAIQGHKKTGTQCTRQKSIDDLLDLYNDYMYMYEIFQDPQYQMVVELAQERLLKLSRQRQDR